MANFGYVSNRRGMYHSSNLLHKLHSTCLTSYSIKSLHKIGQFFERNELKQPPTLFLDETGFIQRKTTRLSPVVNNNGKNDDDDDDDDNNNHCGGNDDDDSSLIYDSDVNRCCTRLNSSDFYDDFKFIDDTDTDDEDSSMKIKGSIKEQRPRRLRLDEKTITEAPTTKTTSMHQNDSYSSKILDDEDQDDEDQDNEDQDDEDQDDDVKRNVDHHLKFEQSVFCDNNQMKSNMIIIGCSMENYYEKTSSSNSSSNVVKSDCFNYCSLPRMPKRNVDDHNDNDIDLIVDNQRCSHFDQNSIFMPPKYNDEEPNVYWKSIKKRLVDSKLRHCVNSPLQYRPFNKMKPPIHSSPLNVCTPIGYATYEMSSDLAQKHLELWCKRYGGYRRATHAALIIQRAYRQYVLAKNFSKMCKRRSGCVAKNFTLDFVSSVSVDDDSSCKNIDQCSGFSNDRRCNKNSNNISVIRIYDNNDMKHIKINRCTLPPSGQPLHICSTDRPTSSGSCSDILSFNSTCVKKNFPYNDDHFVHQTACRKRSLGSLLPSSDSTDLVYDDNLKINEQSGINESTTVECCSIELSKMSKNNLMPDQLVDKRNLIRKRQYRIALNFFNKKPERGIDLLICWKFLERTPEQIARFLFCRKGLSRQMIGEYLGDILNPLNQRVLRCFADLFDMSGIDVDVALRIFQSVFRLPGEAQKIERIIEVFANRYCQCNFDLISKQFKKIDTVFILSFAIILLNTDLHSPNIKSSKKMKLNDFIKNLRGVDNGSDIDKSLLSQIYSRVKQTAFMSDPDHVVQVSKVESSLVGKKPPLIALHRRLVCYCRLSQILDITKKQSPSIHQREIFLFNDTLLITKIFSRKRIEPTYSFRESHCLVGAQVHMFKNAHYLYGIQLKFTLENKMLYFNARTDEDRRRFIDDLKESIFETDEMEALRIELELQKQLGQTGCVRRLADRYGNFLKEKMPENIHNCVDVKQIIRHSSATSLDSGLSSTSLTSRESFQVVHSHAVH